MTFNDWLADHPAVAATKLEGGAWQVFTTDPTIFQVDDWYVMSAVSGPAVILSPKVNA